MCGKFGLDPAYVAAIELEPELATVTLYRGRDGRCQGSKFLVDDDGVDLTRASPEYVPVGPTDVAREVIEFLIRS